MNDHKPKTQREIVLTSNQYAIVLGIVRGDTAATIARSKRRSVDTVRATIRTIYERFGVKSATELRAAVVRSAATIYVVNAERPRDLRSALRVISDVLEDLRSENRRNNTNRRQGVVRLHADEMEAILAAFQAETIEPPSGAHTTE